MMHIIQYFIKHSITQETKILKIKLFLLLKYRPIFITFT
jgi:hypothetical protein